MAETYSEEPPLVLRPWPRAEIHRTAWPVSCMEGLQSLRRVAHPSSLREVILSLGATSEARFQYGP